MTDTGIEFYPLSFVPEGADVIVGRVETGTYAVLPEDGAGLLRRLSAGATVADAAEWYRQTYSEPVDVDDFLESMGELGFIRMPGAEVATPSAAPRFQWLGRALFSGPAWLVYGAIVAAALVELVRRPGLRPAYSQVYFSGSLTTVTVVMVLGTIPLSFLHEAYHVLAGQRLGLHSRLGISNRYTYVVFETRTNGLYSVPRRRRYLPFLAGMLLDVVVVGVLDLAAALLKDGGGASGLVGRMCLALSFAVVTRLAWQFLLHLRTDLYYVLSTALNCYDLHEASRSIFFNRLRRLFGRTAGLIDETQWTDRDRKVGAWYGWLITLGFGTTVFLMLFVTGPIAVTYAARTARELSAGVGTERFWDSLVALLIFVAQIALPAVLAWRKRRHDAARKPKLLTA